MDRPMLEVADIFRRYGDAYRREAGLSLSTAQRRVMTAIERCRTAALGGHVEQCDRCGHARVWYNSCRNRLCPTCQSLARAAWIERRTAELLDAEYFHVVFTVPDEIAVIAAHSKAVVYGILFRAAAETLRTIGADPTHLCAQIGFFAVLHTWGQTLVHHPHLHCVVPAGGLSPDGTHWVHTRPTFFLPVKVLSRVFRGKFVAGLADAFRDGALSFPGDLHRVAEAPAFRAFLRTLYRQDWVVYAKPPFGGPVHVLHYLARYTHRVAISNHRIVNVTDDQVTFRWKDYRHGSQVGLMTLSAYEFLRRFCLHVLPKGFVRIRFYGFLAPRCRTEDLPRCRRVLDACPRQALAAPSGEATPPVSLPVYPRCGGVMIIIERLTARQIYVRGFVEGLVLDSS